MKRKYNYHPVTPQKWDELYQYYLENKNNTDWFDTIFPIIHPYVDMCKKSFNVRSEYWEEYTPLLLQYIWNSFITYDPDRGSKFSTWVYRLAKQSAWWFIKNKCNDMDMAMNQYDVNECNITTDTETPEELYIDNEHHTNITTNLEKIMVGILRGPIEQEVYKRKNGIMGFRPQNTDTIAEELNLTIKTVEQIVTRNNNSINGFKRFIRENEYDRVECIQNLTEIILKYKKAIGKK